MTQKRQTNKNLNASEEINVPDETLETEKVEAIQATEDAKPEAPKPSKVSTVRSKVGLLVDITTGRQYDATSVEVLLKEGSWVDCQIKAGKMETL